MVYRLHFCLFICLFWQDEGHIFLNIIVKIIDSKYYDIHFRGVVLLHLGSFFLAMILAIFAMTVLCVKMSYFAVACDVFYAKKDLTTVTDWLIDWCCTSNAFKGIFNLLTHFEAFSTWAFLRLFEIYRHLYYNNRPFAKSGSSERSTSLLLLPWPNHRCWQW